VIINTDEPDDRQFWSNDQGWVGDLESTTIWMGHEVHKLCPPMSGGWIKKEDKVMSRKRYSAEEIVNRLREAEVLISQGQTVAQACKEIGVTDQTYYRWRKEYGGLKTDQAKRLKALERENARLKRLLADAELDKAILREAANPNF